MMYDQVTPTQAGLLCSLFFLFSFASGVGIGYSSSQEAQTELSHCVTLASEADIVEKLEPQYRAERSVDIFFWDEDGHIHACFN